MLLIEALTLTYPKHGKPLLRELGVTLRPGELLLLKGPNGCGKTSLLNAVSGVVPEHVHADVKGRITLNGIDLRGVALRERYPYLAYQMSDPDAQVFFPDCEKELAFALENQGLPAGEIRSRIDNAASRFNLDTLFPRDPATLSRGEKKLLVFAVCAAMQTPLILLDEPLGGLSQLGIVLMKEWLAASMSEGRMIITAEHGDALDGLASAVLNIGEDCGSAV